VYFDRLNYNTIVNHYYCYRLNTLVPFPALSRYKLGQNSRPVSQSCVSIGSIEEASLGKKWSFCYRCKTGVFPTPS